MSGTDSTHSGKVLVQLLNEITVVVAWHKQKG